MSARIDLVNFRRKTSFPVTVHAERADMMWVARHKLLVDVVVLPFNRTTDPDLKRVYEARNATRALGMSLSLRTVVDPENACSRFSKHVLAVGPLRWTVARGKRADTGAFINFLEKNYRGLRESMDVDIDWGLTSEDLT